MIFKNKSKLMVLSISICCLLASITTQANPFLNKEAGTDVTKGGEERLGVIKSHTRLGVGWYFIEGTEDQFLMTNNGRFAITVEDGRLAVSDIWQMKEIKFSEIEAASEIYPLDGLHMLPNQNKAPPVRFKFGNGEVIGTLFGIPNDPHVNARMAQIDWDKADFAINYYVVPHSDGEEWVRYFCAPKEVQRDLALGKDIKLHDPKKGECDTRKALEHGMLAELMMKLLDVRGVPFAVRHKDWRGSMIRGDFKAFLEGSNKEFLQ